MEQLIQEMKKDYEDGLSVAQIAEKYTRSESWVHRLFKKVGVKIRTRSEAQKLALELGRAKNPTKGVGHSEEAKINMSEKAANRWARMSEAERKKIQTLAKERWEKMSDADKIEMHRRAGVALRKVATEGSEIEQYLEAGLVKAGYNALKHVKDFMNGGYEIDILLKDEGIAIELDGPHHHLPIFGDKRFEQTMKFDAAKNGALIGMGLSVIRVKCLYKKLTEKIKRDTLDLIIKNVEKIRAGEVTSKLVEIEL